MWGVWVCHLQVRVCCLHCAGCVSVEETSSGRESYHVVCTSQLRAGGLRVGV